VIRDVVRGWIGALLDLPSHDGPKLAWKSPAVTACRPCLCPQAGCPPPCLPIWGGARETQGVCSERGGVSSGAQGCWQAGVVERGLGGNPGLVIGRWAAVGLRFRGEKGERRA